MKTSSSEESATRKLEKFFKSLEKEEQEFIATLVSGSIAKAVSAEIEKNWLDEFGKKITETINPDLCPTLVNKLGDVDAGQLVMPKPGNTSKNP